MGTLATAWADVDENGNLIATPREAEMMERGFLFYPPRVIRNNAPLLKPIVTPVPSTAPVSLTKSEPEITEPVTEPKVPEPTLAEEMLKVEPPVMPEVQTNAQAASDKILQADHQNRLTTPQQHSQKTAYVGTGTSTAVGLNIPTEEGLNFRVEYSDGFQSDRTQKSYGNSKYKTKNTDQRLGLFIDWAPLQNNWYVVGGLTLNNQVFHLQAKPDTTMLVNNTSVAIGAGTFTIDYSLPKVTPYVGVRYAHQSQQEKGWEGFAEMGLILAKLNADVFFSSDLSLSKSDVQSEVYTIRKSIYKWGVVPNALVGLSYRY